MADGSDPGQLTLPIDRAHEQTLENFVPGSNVEILGVLARPVKVFTGIWLCGSKGTGKSHLLRGHALAGDAMSQRVYIDASSPGLLTLLDHATQIGEVVAIDEAASLAGDRACEEALMGIYERLRAENGMLLMADRLAATATSFTMPDLNSRMRSLMHFQLADLGDDGKAQILRARADHRGYVLSDAVLDYWLARGPRELQLLLTDLDRLDRASLSRQRHVTIPLLKEVLGY